jgi:hypothetical protein
VRRAIEFVSASRAAGRGVVGKRGVDRSETVSVDAYFDRARILLAVPYALRPGDRNDVVATWNPTNRATPPESCSDLRIMVRSIPSGHA